MDPESALGIVQTSGALGVLTLIVVGSLKAWWVPGWHYREVKAERDRWRDLAWQAMETTDRAVTVAVDAGTGGGDVSTAP